MYQIVRRGDYLEIEITEREAPIEPKKKAEEVNPNIVHIEPMSVKDAINKFEMPAKLNFKDNSRIQTLKDNLRDIERQLKADVKNPDREKQLSEVKTLLADLADVETLDNLKAPQSNFKKGVPPKVAQAPKEVKLLLPVSVTLEQRISKLEALQYPKLQKLEQILAVLVGEKFAPQDKITKAKTPMRFESVGPVYSRYQKLETTIDEFPQLVQRICQAQNDHNQAVEFSERLKLLTNLHHEMLEELNQNSGLAKKLKTNFQENKKAVQHHISNFQARIAKLKNKK